MGSVCGCIGGLRLEVRESQRLNNVNSDLCLQTLASPRRAICTWDIRVFEAQRRLRINSDRVIRADASADDTMCQYGTQDMSKVALNLPHVRP